MTAFLPKIVGTALVMGGVLSLSVEARAQAEDAPVEETADTAVQTIPNGAVEAPARETLDPSSVSLEDKKERVEEMLVTERKTLGRVVQLLAEARSSKDIVQLNCVNEKLIQVKGLLKISEKASLEMYEAIASGADDLINHEYTKVAVAHQKSQVLSAEAEQCVGESSVYAGDTDVDVEIDNDDGSGGGGGDPTTNAAAPPGPTVPPVASTF
ncbi:MAG: hypothetical protein AAFZ18_04890 [Myxococcota bacterium]